MDFIPYSRQSVSEDDILAVSRVLRSDFLTQGPAVERLETAFASRHQTAHAVAVSNATAGLHLACLALGVGPGARVWTSPNSFVASANCALYCGASVDFVDIDPLSKNMCLGALQEKLRRAADAGELPTVVVPVDFAGLPADLREMRSLADRYGFRIIEDASHATGASYLGAPVGSRFSDATVFSFHAVKIITGGEGGVVTTPHKEVADRMRRLRSHGITRNAEDFEGESDGPWYYQQLELGFNYRMTDIQAALVASQLERLTDFHELRISLARRYFSLLSNTPLLMPSVLSDRLSAWHLFVVEVPSFLPLGTRNFLFQSLRTSGVGVNIHYIPIHLQPFYRRLGFRPGQFPNSEAYYSRAISLPLYPDLKFAEQDRISQLLIDLLSQKV